MTTRQVVIGTLLVILMAIGFYGLFYFRVTLGVVFLGVLIGTASRPIADRIRNAGFSPNLAIAGVFLLLMAVLIGLSFAAVPWLLDTTADILDRAASFY